jgi:hypothetical protein
MKLILLGKWQMKNCIFFKSSKDCSLSDYIFVFVASLASISVLHLVNILIFIEETKSIHKKQEKKSDFRKTERMDRCCHGVEP